MIEPRFKQPKRASKAEQKRRGHLERMATLRPIVFARAGWRCERCGLRDGERRADGSRAILEAHHRLMRGQGGPDTLENLVSLCGFHGDSCHVWVHARPALARACGLLVPKHEGPPREPWISPL